MAFGNVDKTTGEITYTAGGTDVINKVQVVTTMPAASVDYLHKSLYYVGSDAEPYQKDTLYTCVLDQSEYVWLPQDARLVPCHWVDNTGFDVNLTTQAGQLKCMDAAFNVYGDEELVVLKGSSTITTLYIYNRSLQQWEWNGSPSAVNVRDTTGRCRLGVNGGAALSNFHVYARKIKNFKGYTKRNLIHGAYHATSSGTSQNTVMTFGDSIMCGIYAGGVSKYIPHYFFAPFGFIADANGFKPVSGSTYTVQGGRTRLLSTLQANDLTNLYGLIYIACGINDWGVGADLNTFKESVEETFEYILANTSAQVVIQSPLNVNAHVNVTTTWKYPVEEYRRILEQYANKYGFIYLDGGKFETFPMEGVGAQSTWSDGLHPTEKGYMCYAMEIASKLNLIFTDNIEALGGITWTRKTWNGCPVYKIHLSGSDATANASTMIGTARLKPVRLVSVKGCVYDATYCLQLGWVSGAGGGGTYGASVHVRQETGEVYLQSPYANYDIELELAMTEAAYDGSGA